MRAAPLLFATLSDAELIDRVSELARQERRATWLLVAALAELDRRKLYLPEGYASLFAYCTRALHLSEHAAYNRIEAARASARFPAVLTGLEAGTLTLSAIRLLAPVLTTENQARLIEGARHKSKRDIELLVATARPQADTPAVIRRLPGAADACLSSTTRDPRQSTDPGQGRPAGADAPPPRASTVPAPPPRAVSTPLSAVRYKIQFTASREFHDKLRRLQALLRHAVPSGDLAEILERALDLLLNTVEKKKAGFTGRPAPARPSDARSRHIPAAVKREVWKRDGGRCAFDGPAGRCGETAFLEYHHIVPFAAGGPATTANIALRCRSHNAHEADELARLLFTDERDDHSVRDD